MVDFGIFGRKTADDNSLENAAAIGKIFDHLQGNARGFPQRVPVNPGANGWKGNAPNPIILRQDEAIAVTGGQQFGLAAFSALVNRPDRVNDIAGRQTIPFSHAGLPRRATADPPALLQKLRPGRPVNGSIHAPAAQQSFIGRIDDRLHLHSRNIAGDYFYFFRGHFFKNYHDGKGFVFPPKTVPVIIILTALHLEARPILQHFGLKKEAQTRRLPVYRGDNLCLAVCGAGKVQAAAATGWVLGKYGGQAGQGTVAINFGLAGCAAGAVPVGELFSINKITDQAANRSFYPEMALKFSLPEKSLITCYQPVTKDRAVDIGDSLADMEGSGFFSAAVTFLPVERIVCLKMVSDHLEGEKLDKSRMTSLIEARLKDIAHVINLCDNLIEEDRDPLKLENRLFLGELAKSLRLTATQQHQLLDWSRGYVIRTGNNLDSLRPFLSRQFSGKASRNRILESIKHELLAE